MLRTPKYTPIWQAQTPLPATAFVQRILSHICFSLDGDNEAVAQHAVVGRISEGTFTARRALRYIYSQGYRIGAAEPTQLKV